MGRPGRNPGEGRIVRHRGLAPGLQEIKPAAAMHFASHCYVGESVTDPAKYYRDNLSNAMNLWGVMREAKVNYFILSSTCATYGDPVHVPMSESHPQNPVN